MSYNGYILKNLLQKEHIVAVLDALGAHSIKNDPNGIRCSCPIHKSNGGTVFTYNPSLHLYICYGECKDEHKEGDIVTLVQICQDCSFDTAIEFICEAAAIDIKLVQDSEEFILENLKNKIDGILIEISDKDNLEEDREYYYGVKPIDPELASKMIGQLDEEGYIDGLGFKDSTLELFESGYDENDKRWLLPIRSPEGDLLGFDGRDITNKSKMKWKKRKNLLKNLILGRLDIVGEAIEKENKVVIVEGKKDMMSTYETGLNYVTCTYGSTLAKEQYELLCGMVSDEIIIFPDGDAAGYKHAQSVLKYCYPEFLITAMETPDGEDPGTLSKKFILELYKRRIPIEEWLKIYKYRTKRKKVETL